MSTLDTSLAAKHSGNAALTVTEILAITAIISGAAALLLPSLSMARRIERRMACGGNERQIAMAWQAYLQDNDGCFPKGLNANVR